MTCTGQGVALGRVRSEDAGFPIKKRRLVNVADKIVFTRGVPPPEAFPTEELGACFDAAVRENPDVVLQYGQQPGYAPLREELAGEYEVSPQEILIGNGSLQLLDLVSSYLGGAGAGVV